MAVEQREMEKLLVQTLERKRMGPAQIPELDLYIDQIITLFEDHLGEQRRREDDKLLTKSMVNNYSKEKLLRPIKGKKYNREQVLQILMIFYLKNALSIGDIKLVMGRLMEEGGAEELERIFGECTELWEGLPNLTGQVAQKLRERFGEEMSTQDLASLLLGIAGLSSYLRQVAEQMVDQFFA